jgi:hypothetical protein
VTRAETIDEEAVEIEVLSNRLRCPKDSDIISIPYRSLSLAIITIFKKGSISDLPFDSVLPLPMLPLDK